MKTKIYKIRVEKNEYQAIKVISCSTNVKMLDLMRVVVLTFIDHQTPLDKPIKRKTKFDDMHVINIPIGQETDEALLKHKYEEGVSTTTILNNAITHWLKVMGVNVKTIAPNIDKEDILNKYQ